MISRVELKPFHTLRRSGDESQHVLVSVFTESGAVGHGEIADILDIPLITPDLDDLARTIENMLVGLDARQTIHISWLLKTVFTRRFNDPFGAIRAGIDMAVFDLAAKARNQSLSEYLGGPIRSRIKVCYPLFRSLNESDIRSNLAIVESMLMQGFDVFRTYLGGNPACDVAFMEALHQEFGHSIHMQAFDFSNHLLPQGSIHLIENCIRFYEPDYIESVAPFDDLEGMAEVRRRVNIPVSEHVQDASDALRMRTSRAIDIINVSNATHGGIFESLRMFDLADALGLRCILSTTQGTSLSTAAEAHIGASVVNLDFPTVSVGPLLYTKDVVINPIQYSSGYMMVPNGPGLGVSVDMGALEECGAPLRWSTYAIDTSLHDWHDKHWRVDLSRGVQGSKKK